MTAEDSTKSSYQKLEGEQNYQRWKSCTEATLKAKEVWEIVIGEETVPVKPLEDEYTTKKEYSEALEKYELKKKAWNKNNAVALSLVLNMTVNHIQDKTRNIKDAHAFWKFLEARYEASGYSRVYSAMMKLSNIVEGEVKKVDRYAGDFSEALQEVKDLGAWGTELGEKALFIRGLEKKIPNWTARVRTESSTATKDLESLVVSAIDEQRIMG